MVKVSFFTNVTKVLKRLSYNLFNQKSLNELYNLFIKNL